MPANPRRKPLISGNWKMHHNHFEAIATVQKLSYNLTAADYEDAVAAVSPQGSRPTPARHR